MVDVAVNLQTPIMRSVVDKLNAIKKENRHANVGESIGWIIDEMERCCGKNDD